MADSLAAQPVARSAAVPGQTAEPTPRATLPTPVAPLVSQRPVSQPISQPPVSQPASHTSPSTSGASHVANHLPEPRPLATTSGNAGIAPGSSGARPRDVTPKPVFMMKRTGGATLPLPTPVSPSATSTPSHAPFAEPEPAQIVSDILPPQPFRPPATPSSGRVPAASSLASNGSDALRKTKYASAEERRRATSLALKQRWAAGLMDHVHKKAGETIKRKKAAGSALASPSGVSKPSTPLSVLGYVPGSSSSPRRPPNLPGLSATPSARHVNKRSLVSEQLARLFQYSPAPAAPAQTAESRSGTSSEERREPARQPSSTTPDVEMAGTEPPPNRVAALSHEQETPARAVAPEDEDSEYAASDGGVSSVQSGPDIDDTRDFDEEVEEAGEHGGHGGNRAIEMATEDRPYMRWRDEDGSLKPTYGTLIPEGYQLSDDIPGYPWVCPIRSCRKTFAKVVQLGGHFIRAHRGALLHDNQDGTLSERGRRRLRQADKGSSQSAIIVSRGPADPADQPVVATTGPASTLPQPPILRILRNRAFADDGIDVSAPSSPSPYELDSKLEGDAASLWSYIEPHLIKHKGNRIPEKGHVHKLLDLPRVRDLDWNPTWLATHPFNDTNPRDISALIVQVTGERAPKPCYRCSIGKGPFTSCVMISPKAGSDPLRNILSCANCFYHFGQTYCTHKQWGKARATAILSERGERSPAADVPDEAEVEEEDGEREEHEEEMDDGEKDVMDYSMASDLPSANGIPVGIVEAEPGRRYTEWPAVNGEMGPLFGALLPAKYQLDTTIPGRSWACPVRSCRKAFCTRSDLGFHFKRAHCAAILNDNCDGTFSEDGVYRDRRKCIGKGGKILVEAPPVVISKRALKTAGPLPKAQLPAYLMATTPSRPAPTLEDLPPKPKIVDPKPKRLDNKETPGLWTYIHSHLLTTNDRPSNTAVKELLMLPKQRDVEYNNHRRATHFAEEASRDVAALVMQVVGDEAAEPCSRCRQGKGPFAGCVLVPDIARHTKKRYPCCANCLYRGKKLYCSLIQPGRDGAAAAAEASVQTPQVFPPRELRAVRSTLPQPAAPSGVQQPLGSSALISQGVFQDQEGLLEMEEWEMAPGRIRESAPEADGEAIAFSKPYLSTPYPVPVCADVSFRVDTVLAGGTLELAAEADTTRLCSVAAGKVRVAIGDEAEFLVGPHGMFKVRAGIACVVRNGMYLDAVVHTVLLGGVE